MIKLVPSFYADLSDIQWFERCGSSSTPLALWRVAHTLDEALNLLRSDHWADIRTQAQGDLTGYLAGNHYSAYGGNWNRLARESRLKIETLCLSRIRLAMSAAGLPDISNEVLLDVNRAALEVTYAHHFPKVPRFFYRLLEAYASGRMPCGWTGRLERWPEGELIVF